MKMIKTKASQFFNAINAKYVVLFDDNVPVLAQGCILLPSLPLVMPAGTGLLISVSPRY